MASALAMILDLIQLEHFGSSQERKILGSGSTADCQVAELEVDRVDAGCLSDSFEGSLLLPRYQVH